MIENLMSQARHDSSFEKALFGFTHLDHELARPAALDLRVLARFAAAARTPISRLLSV